MNSILKLLEYIRKVSAVPIECDGKSLKTPDKVVVSPSFFLQDSCNVCGKCCSGDFNTVYTESGLNWIKSCPDDEFFNKDMYGDNPIPLENRQLLLESIICHQYNVNGKEVNIYESPVLPMKSRNSIKIDSKPNASPRCRWMISDVPGLFRCGIHPIRSVTCGLPHCRLNYNNQSRVTSFTVGQYGRNWALGCPIDLKNAPMSWESTKVRIQWLMVLEKCAEDLGIETILPRLFEYFKEHEDEFVNGIFPSSPVVFEVHETHKKLFEVKRCH